LTPDVASATKAAIMSRDTVTMVVKDPHNDLTQS